VPPPLSKEGNIRKKNLHNEGLSQGGQILETRTKKGQKCCYVLSFVPAKIKVPKCSGPHLKSRSKFLPLISCYVNADSCFSEIKIQDIVSEPTIGKMRLQFWRDSLENTFQVK